jgi:mRNA interferase RelE/StbE
MSYSWEVSEVLRREIRHLPPELKFKVRGAFDDIRARPKTGKPLEEDLAEYRSYRIGKYRLIYRIKENRLILEAFGSRRDIYERLVLEIGRAKIRERSAKYRVKPRKLLKK